jgi:excinuclease ABC subunit A
MAQREATTAEQAIEVRGARTHNLRNIDVNVPLDRLVVLTGVSGSGKSTLAFDTIFAEGQRRYIEGLSTHARLFLDQLERPDVDTIEDLPPTVAIDQKSAVGSPRSTVATLTEAHYYLRLLYARCGLPHCPNCGRPIQRQTPEQVVASVLALGDGKKVMLMAPLARGRKGANAEAFAAIRRAGLIRARVDGTILEVGPEDPKLAKSKAHSVEAIVDRLVVREGIRARLSESVDLALKLGDGTIVLSSQEGESWHDRTLSVHFACPDCLVGLCQVEPRTFSFNSPHGACPTCQGLGTVRVFDESLVLPDRSRSLEVGAVAPWTATGKGAPPVAPPDEKALASFLKRHRINRNMPLNEWSAESLQVFLQGDDGWPGLLPSLERTLESATRALAREWLEAVRSNVTCPACQGTRLRPEARAVTLGGLPIAEFLALDVPEARSFLKGLSFDPPLDEVGPPLVAEVDRRLAFLVRVGLRYLTLDRPTDTLSGGELQRVRLATQIGSGLVGVCYVLDEPTTGLHPRDTDRLLASLADLRDAGNSVLIVEHDEATIRAADWVIDLGPGAGPFGGLVIAQGPPSDLRESEPGVSLTRRYLELGTNGDAHEDRRRPGDAGWITVHGASEHNLKHIHVRFPLGALTCVTGVSGSGKSTLVLDILARSVRRHLEHIGPAPGAHRAIEGLESIEQVVIIDQSPIGRTTRSTPATYTGLYDTIRMVFAATREARVRGFGVARFSFNVKGGRCEACQGQGVRKVEMSFIPDLMVRCPVCDGRRFNRATLGVHYRGKSVADMLDMRVDEARDFFDAVPAVVRGLEALRDAGLGYVTLGQPASTLSGGEAQRVKLAAELGRANQGRCLYILDEPTTGLHFADVATLLNVLRRLVEQGNTMVVIEHNLDVIRHADWVVDLGPEGGHSGGQLVAEGTPAELATNPESVTGRYL